MLGKPCGVQADPGPSENSSSPFMSSETSGKLINLPEAQFPPLEVGAEEL